MRKVFLILTMAAPIVLGVATSAQATTISCPDTAGGGDREFSLTTDPRAISCVFGSGNINGNNDYINDTLNGLNFWTTLDASDNSTTGTVPFKNALTITVIDPGSGTFDIDPAVWGSYGRVIIALKSGGGGLTPDWAAFELPNGVTTGGWAISDQGFSHALLYGTGVPEKQLEGTAVPEPMSLALLGAGLTFGARSLRRKK